MSKDLILSPMLENTRQHTISQPANHIVSQTVTQSFGSAQRCHQCVSPINAHLHLAMRTMHLAARATHGTRIRSVHPYGADSIQEVRWPERISWIGKYQFRSFQSCEELHCPVAVRDAVVIRFVRGKRPLVTYGDVGVGFISMP